MKKKGRIVQMQGRIMRDDTLWSGSGGVKDENWKGGIQLSCSIGDRGRSSPKSRKKMKTKKKINSKQYFKKRKEGG